MGKRSNKSLAIATVALLMLAIALVVILLLVRHKNSPASSLSAVQTNIDKQQIETNWKTFFAANTSLENRVKLLQNGSNFTQPIQTEFTALGSQSSSAVIGSVSLTNSTSANIVYTINLNGQPVLTNEKGEALFLNNTWQVSDSTLCQLLGLGGVKPAACQNS